MRDLAFPAIYSALNCIAIVRYSLIRIWSTATPWVAQSLAYCQGAPKSVGLRRASPDEASLREILLRVISLNATAASTVNFNDTEREFLKLLVASSPSRHLRTSPKTLLLASLCLSTASFSKAASLCHYNFAARDLTKSGKSPRRGLYGKPRRTAID